MRRAASQGGRVLANRRHGQRGFLQRLWQVVGAAILLALAGRFAWWVATERDFGQVAAILWAIGFGAAYLITLGNVFVLRLAAGFWVFVLVGLVSLPLSWMAGSRAALIALLCAQLVFSYYAGRAITARRRVRDGARLAGDPGPPDGDLVADFGRWILLSFLALMVLLIGPLLVLLLVSVVADLSQLEMKLAVASWGCFAVAWFGFRSGAARRGGVPACIPIYLVVTGTLLAADLLAGPFAEGSGVQVAYVVLPGALVAAFAEVFVFKRGGAAIRGI